MSSLALPPPESAKEVRLRAETALFDANREKALAEVDRYRRLRDEEDATAAASRVFTFYGNVSDASVAQCMSALGHWARRDEGLPIKVIFASPGGSIFDGFALYDFLRELSAAGHSIETVAHGFAFSMGAVLLQAGDKRVMGRNSYLLIHEAHVNVAGQISSAEDSVVMARNLNQRCLELLAARTNMTAAQIARKWKRKEWWIDSDAALAHGFVDEVR